MNLKLQIVFILASVLTIVFIVRKIRKHGLNIDDSIVWIIWSIVILILSIFPDLSVTISNKLGFMSTSNFIFSLFTFFLYIILFIQTIKISSLKEKQKEMIQKLSILEYKNRNKEK